MGMTNRVIPAQGEERGASFTLIWLDGDESRKFQSPQQQNFLICPQCRESRKTGGISANTALNFGYLQL
jgi:hypothetical protein